MLRVVYEFPLGMNQIAIDFTMFSHRDDPGELVKIEILTDIFPYGMVWLHGRTLLQMFFPFGMNPLKDPRNQYSQNFPI